MSVSKGNKKVLKKWQPYFLIFPVLAVFTVFMFYPFFKTLYMSFFQGTLTDSTQEFVGFENYSSIFHSSDFMKILGNTLLYILLFLIFALIAPYIFAFILSFCINKGKEFYKATFFLPSVISVVVGTMIFTWLLNPLSGPVAGVAAFFGIEVPIWTETQSLVILGMSIITCWKIFGYNFIVIMAGIGSVPLEIIESARMDNIPNWRIFLNIVVPMSSSTGIYVLIMAIVTGLQQVFTPIMMITQGGPNSASSNLMYEVYDQAFAMFDPGIAAAYAMIMMILFAFLLWLEFRFVEKGVYYSGK